MRQATLATLFLFVPLSMGVAAESKAKGVNFVPPHAVYASDIPYPINSVASGLVELSVNLDGSGHIKDVQTIRDIPSLTAPALVAVNGWIFAPAMLDGQAEGSSLPVNVLFNPGKFATALVPLQGAAPQADSGNGQEYVPPQVVSAFYAAFPVKAVLAGPVVLDVRVNRSGRVRSASAIYTTPSLRRPAISAVKKWRFTPGRFRGVPIDANVVVAFVFRSPTLITP
jgi:outer membrane biosynthesis protein TonB